jgi:hypothetical protein
MNQTVNGCDSGRASNSQAVPLFDDMCLGAVGGCVDNVCKRAGLNIFFKIMQNKTIIIYQLLLNIFLK